MVAACARNRAVTPVANSNTDYYANSYTDYYANSNTGSNTH